MKGENILMDLSPRAILDYKKRTLSAPDLRSIVTSVNLLESTNEDHYTIFINRVVFRISLPKFQ